MADPLFGPAPRRGGVQLAQVIGLVAWTTVNGAAPTHEAQTMFRGERPRLQIAAGGMRLAKLGEDITETLEVIPRQWKVIQHVQGEAQ
jgi:zinc-finger binding domain of transposase IS66